MEITDLVSFKRAKEIKTELGYLIDTLNSEDYNCQDYLDVKELEKSLEQIQKDIDDYRLRVESECEDLKVGNILKIIGGDGISYTEIQYVYVKKIDQDNVFADVVTLHLGDFGRMIKLDMKEKLYKNDLIKKYKNNYHWVLEDLNEWYQIINYLEKMPWPDQPVK